MNERQEAASLIRASVEEVRRRVEAIEREIAELRALYEQAGFSPADLAFFEGLVVEEALLRALQDNSERMFRALEESLED